MKKNNKIFNILLVFALLISMFIPSFNNIVYAEENDIDMSKQFKVYIYYPSLNENVNRVAINSYDTYEQAKEEMNKIDSKSYATAAIECDGAIIDADYAIVHMDSPGGNRVTYDNLINIYPTAESAYYGTYRAELTYVAGTWGVDAAFLEYNPKYGTYKVKINGVTGWLKMSQVSVVPIASYYGYTRLYTNNRPKLYITATTAITLRTGPGVENTKVCDECAAVPGATYVYYPEKTKVNAGYTWYYINTGTHEGYIASANEEWVKIVNTLLTDTFYYTHNNNLHHYIHMGWGKNDYSQIVGEAPFYYSAPQTKTYFLKNNANTCNHVTYPNITNRYLSFDGNYFYETFDDMIDDYRSGEYKKAINSEHPYYSYFLYQPSRTKTSITADVINQSIINKGITSGLTHDVSYYYDQNGNLLHGLGTESILYNKGQLFIDVANTYGVNPLSVYTAAMRESGNGTSAIALLKNNLFGYGAIDGNAFNGAKTYASIAESIDEYARNIGGSGGYSNFNDYRYHGTHKGNKLSGTFTYYMSDPYGGEKDAGATYLTDAGNGFIEMYSNTLGIKNGLGLVSIYKKPSSTSEIIYQTKNYATGKILSNMPFIVSDKIEVYENGRMQGYYKVYTDVPLDQSQNVNFNELYNFNYSYGYIKEEDLYVQNNQPVINAKNIEVEQFSEIDLKQNVTATDYEDGDLTNKIVATTDADITTPGEYDVIYTVTDRSNYSKNTTVKLTIIPTLNPIIEASDIKIKQYTIFEPKKGVKVIDNTYGDITDSLEVVSHDVNPNVMGIYSITYKATNKDGRTTTKTVKVEVLSNEKPVINALDKTVYLNSSFDYLEGVTATDFEDGVITDRITYEGSVDITQVGTYPITYKVIDNSNQEVTKVITITVEEKLYIEKESIFHLEKLLYNEETKKVDFTGFLIIKGMNNTKDIDINYSFILKNQYNGNTIIKSLKRLEENYPFSAPSLDGYNYSDSWFQESLDLSDVPSGDYDVYIRARGGDFEANIPLRNAFFNEKVSSKFKIDETGFQFKTNYFKKFIPIELIVRENGLISGKNNPTVDNIYNQLYSISLEGSILNITSSSHNVKGDYGVNANVERYIIFENIENYQRSLKTNVGFITDGPYKVTLKIDDGFDKTKAWYKASIDLSTLEKGIYSINVNTKTGEIDDYGELYDIISDINFISQVGDKKITVRRNTDIRYRIEVIVE